MRNSKIEDFFYSGNAVGGEPDYRLAETFVRTAEAFANATYQSVYIIDYFRKNFLFVSPNPLFLCGMPAEEVKGLGYQFYRHTAQVLNETEKEILTLSIQGRTINAIAERAHLAVDSVKSARRKLFEKLEVNNISEAISYATNYKLI